MRTRVFFHVMAKRRRYAWGWTLVGLTIGAGWLAYSRSDIALAANSLEEQRAAARREGLKLDYADLHPNPIPEKENAAELFLRMVKESGRLRSGMPKAPVRANKEVNPLNATSSELSVIRARVAYISPALDLTETMVKRPRLVLDRPFEMGPDLLLPEYAEAKFVGRMVATRARLRCRDRDMTGALRDVETLARMASLLREDPISIAVLIRVSIEAQALAVLNDVLAWRKPSASDLDRAQHLIRSLARLPDMRDSLRGYLVESANAIRYFVAHLETIQSSDCPMVDIEDEWKIRLAAVRRANETHTIEYWRQVYAILAEDTRAYLPAAARLDGLQAEWDQKSGMGYLLLALTCPHISEMVRQFQVMATRRQVALSGISVLRSWLASGAWPENLPQDAGGTRDPFQRGRFLYRASKKGFVLYSVGKNGTDDGGVQRKKERIDDLAFEYPWVAR